MGTLVDRYRATEHPTPRPHIKGPGTPGPKDHTYSPWFKSTLLLFLRLLLSTKKRWPAKPFFFLLPGKTGHREWYITDLQTWRELSEHTADGVAL